MLRERGQRESKVFGGPDRGASEIFAPVFGQALSRFVIATYAKPPAEIVCSDEPFLAFDAFFCYHGVSVTKFKAQRRQCRLVVHESKECWGSCGGDVVLQHFPGGGPGR
jgi:hypothetical protein